jgi:rsbT antagonist protein RsbS
MQLVHDCLVASVQVELSDEVLRVFQQDLLGMLRTTRARAVILDLSGVSILDSHDFESIRRTLLMAGLMSAAPIIVGLRPGIAASLVELGVSADDVAACLTLEQAFERVERQEAASGRDR